MKRFLPDKLRAPFREYSDTRSGSGFRDVFIQAEPRCAFVTPVNPYALNERLVAQQGTFLCPGDVTRSFEENLFAMPSVTEGNSLRKILLRRSVLGDAFSSLRRMNSTHSTLFPGLDGYARSLWHRIQDDNSYDGTRF